ncbi:MAG TPA: RES family NAD+ phosphorylase [Bryobacteraceae bacterium]|nr:RES family NAD+ phosphorylase [Bryobacteraceae bacterium]
MTEVYRLHSGRYLANDGRGASANGGRWNPKGTEVIYAAASRSLAVIEILVHYSVLPRDFVITPIFLPDSISLIDVPKAVLASGWDQPIPMPVTQEYGRAWIASKGSAVLRVPSAVIPREWNYVINVFHPEFPGITFGPPDPFSFDPRLK